MIRSIHLLLFLFRIISECVEWGVARFMKSASPAKQIPGSKFGLMPAYGMLYVEEHNCATKVKIHNNKKYNPSTPTPKKREREMWS
jgi:hypothetical protein